MNIKNVCRRNGRKVVTGEVVIMNNALTVPQKCFGTKKYATTIVLSESNEQTILAIQEAMLEAFKEKGVKKCEEAGIEPEYSSFMTPLRKGSNNGDIYYLRTTTREKPAVVDKELALVDSKMSICDGALARVSMAFDCAAIPTEDKKGFKKIIFSTLHNVQILDNSNNKSSLGLDDLKCSVQEDFFDDEESAEQSA